MDDIISEVKEEITTRCSCVFEVDSETFSCRGAQGNFENTVVFRARITVQGPAALVAADDVVSDINDWVETSPSITVGLNTLKIDSSCPAMLASTDSDDCEAVTVSPSPSSPPSSSDSSSSIGIIVGAVVAVVVVILIIVVIVVILLVCVRRKGSYR